MRRLVNGFLGGAGALALIEVSHAFGFFVALAVILVVGVVLGVVRWRKVTGNRDNAQ